MCALCRELDDEIEALWRVLEESAPDFQVEIRPAIEHAIVVRQARRRGLHPTVLARASPQSIDLARFRDCDKFRQSASRICP